MADPWSWRARQTRDKVILSRVLLTPDQKGFSMALETCSGLLSAAGEDEEPIPTHYQSPIQHNPEIPPIRNLTCERPFICQEFVSVQALTA